jgi:lysophospholipase L1-like esterase
MRLRTGTRRPSRGARVVASLSAMAALCGTALLAGPATADDPDPIATPAVTTDASVHYYVALGDSLSQGYMPGQGDTDQGYVDLLHQKLLAEDPDLQLVKLGCSGETTQTMIDGGKCTDRYQAGHSQLDVAAEFLRDHPGQVSYLTLDIGANDVTKCAAGGSIDPACLVKGALVIGQNLNTILSRLRAAAGSTPPLSIGMAYYDPFLEQWLHGFQGQLVAIASVAALVAINTTESVLYSTYGFRVADAAAAFRTADLLSTQSVPGFGTLPTAVAYICKYTFMCTQQDIHANAAGYQLLADAFAKRIG